MLVRMFKICYFSPPLYRVSVGKKQSECYEALTSVHKIASDLSYAGRV